MTGATIATVERFTRAFNAHDIDAIMATMTDDCVFENTTPPPDGEQIASAAAVRAWWEALFPASPVAWFEIEELVAVADRCVLRWRYTWSTERDATGHVRGVDVFTVRDRKVAEKLLYVKG